MRVLLLHDLVAADAPPDVQDTLVQARAVAAALRALGHDVAAQTVDDDLSTLRTCLAAARADVVFNLVESIAGSDAGAVAVPALLDGLGVHYSGSSAAAIALTNDKCAAKRLLRRLGVPTPDWFPDRASDFVPGRYVVKARFEHGSVGIDADAIVHLSSPSDAAQAVARAESRFARPCFAERFVDGREFNLSVLDEDGTTRVLPPAEIDFSAFPHDEPRLVGYRAKWDEGSFAYHHTPRRFDFAAEDAPLLASLTAIARGAFEALGLRGYARVDFRVDVNGPWVLEVNANPCLSPDAGFAAALARAGIPYRDAIAAILRASSNARAR